MERRKKLFRPLSTRKKRFLDLEIFFKLAHFYNSLIDLCQFIAKTTTFWYKKYFFSQWSTLEMEISLDGKNANMCEQNLMQMQLPMDAVLRLRRRLYPPSAK